MDRSKSAGSVRYTTLKVRLYPTQEQEELFEKTFGCCRYIWNQMLSDQQRFYLETGAHFIPTPAKYKTGAPFLKEVDNQALIQEYNQLSQAFRVFFKNPQVFGAPRFKRKRTTGIPSPPVTTTFHPDQRFSPPGKVSA